MLVEMLSQIHPVYTIFKERLKIQKKKHKSFFINKTIDVSICVMPIREI